MESARPAALPASCCAPEVAARLSAALAPPAPGTPASRRRKPTSSNRAWTPRSRTRRSRRTLRLSSGRDDSRTGGITAMAASRRWLPIASPNWSQRPNHSSRPAWLGSSRRTRSSSLMLAAARMTSARVSPTPPAPGATSAWKASRSSPSKATRPSRRRMRTNAISAGSAPAVTGGWPLCWAAASTAWHMAPAPSCLPTSSHCGRSGRGESARSRRWMDLAASTTRQAAQSRIGRKRLRKSEMALAKRDTASAGHPGTGAVPRAIPATTWPAPKSAKAW
mmetsp:Transcript_103045/g.327574  ORF Transcript_103045/g.327574 Transcript_103045/m.327574 type:complete len:279 (+) Transcript_103045:687-1523(+)